ncbi:hypothetical protein SDC9_183103 [bioreactor metagenome]|uniref:Uncharacterized protein n=1 Tax=bioreactor metagenome TaxID=1076179 RepID=A0A645H9D0_9ZZZZ
MLYYINLFFMLMTNLFILIADLVLETKVFVCAIFEIVLLVFIMPYYIFIWNKKLEQILLIYKYMSVYLHFFIVNKKTFYATDNDGQSPY